MLFIAATTAPSLSSEAVMTTGISSPVLIESALTLGDTSDSKGRITPETESREYEMIKVEFDHHRHYGHESSLPHRKHKTT